jgi:hypothetical protein
MNTEVSEEVAAAVKTSVIHAAGDFYQATNAKGIYFFGPKDKAELFAKGEYTADPRLVVDEGALVS